MSQSLSKVFGPDPKRLLPESTALEILRVVERVGRTSVLFNPAFFESRVPRDLSPINWVRRSKRQIIERSAGKKVGLDKNLLWKSFSKKKK